MRSHREDNFFNRLVEETYQLNEKNNVVYLNTNLNQALQDLDISFFASNFVPSISCFRFNVKGMLIDFPCNWSIFSFIRSKVESNENDFLQLDKDEDKLSEVLDQFSEYPSEIIFLIYERQVYLAYLPEGNSKVKEQLSKIIKVVKVVKAA